VSDARKIVFIGIDALDKDLVLQWSGEGLLPNFERLLKSSLAAVTDPPRGLYVGGVWPSFATACGPARHCSYCFRQLRLGSYDDLATNPDDLKAEPFWQPLNRAGKKIAVIDLPRVPLTRDLNGIHLVDWCGHDAIYPKTCSWPATLAKEIPDRFGPNQAGDCDIARRDAQDYKDLRDMLVARAAIKARASADLLEREEWDLFMTVFSESHCAGHQCWHIHDDEVPRHEPSVRAEVGDVMRDVYIAIDREIGWLLAKIPEDRTVFVLASHGMGPHFDATYLLDDILRRIEGVQPERGARGFAHLHRFWQRSPRRFRRAMRFFDGARKHRIRSRLLARDRSRRKYFSVSNNDSNGAIRINLVGREPSGIVNPGAEFDAVCEELIRELRELKNFETDELLVKDVFYTRDFHQGPYLEHLPDLLIEWNRDASIRHVGSERIGSIRGEWLGIRSGDHRPEGLLFARGPGMTPGWLDRHIPIVDVSATISELLGETLEGVDGRPIPELCRT
jgi:predicted AlkP superfamily phosphohydrolase/phosphomutase